MGEYDSILAQLTDEEITQLSHPEMEPSFEEIVPLLESIRSDLSGANMQNRPIIPVDRISNVNQSVLNSLPEILREIKTFKPMEQTNPRQAHNQLIEQVRGHQRTVADSLRPYLSPDYSSLESARVDLETKAYELNSKLAEANEALGQIRIAAVQKGTAGISGYYHNAADDHRTLAGRYLVFAAIFGVILIIVTLVAFYAAPPSIPSTPGSTVLISFIRDALGRILVLLLVATAVAFCARNYRINKHLEVINRTRYNALETAALYIVGVNDEARNIVVSELVRSVFSPADTGYTSADREQTIIENPGSLIGLLSASNGKQG